MFRSLCRALPVLILPFVIAACGKKPAATTAPAPETPPPPAVAVEVEEPADPPTAAPAESPYAGSWEGNSGPDLPLSFSVEGNQVTGLNASYAGRNGTCSFNGSFGSDGPSVLNGKTFTSHGKTDRGPIEFTVTGAFTSPTEASGTVVWKGKSDLCGDINLEGKWTAKKAAALSDGY